MQKKYFLNKVTWPRFSSVLMYIPSFCTHRTCSMASIMLYELLRESKVFVAHVSETK